jgi:hypothetical protein
MLIILDRDARQQATTSLMSEQSHLREDQWDWREEAIVAITLSHLLCFFLIWLVDPSIRFLDPMSGVVMMGSKRRM